jgi:hypothetical protein
MLSSVLRTLLLRPLPEQSRFAPGCLHRCVSVLLMIVMISNSAMASPLFAHALAETARIGVLTNLQSVSLWLDHSGWAARLSPVTRSLAALMQIPFPAGQIPPKNWDGIGAPPNTPPTPKKQET